jgi:UDP-glucose 4-epimerase
MKVAITGGAGFVGSHVVDMAVHSGHEVIVIDNLVTGHKEWLNIDIHDFYQCDLNELHADLLQRVDAIIHLAAYADLRHNWESTNERNRLYRDNVDGTRRLLECMPNVPIAFASTASVYGAQRNPAPVIESGACPETMQSPYAASKFACEALIASYAYARHFPWFCFRFVNVVGKHTRHGVIGDFVKMQQASGHIHAKDNGKQRKSWVHADDAAGAVLTAVENGLYSAHSNQLGMPSGVYNLTSKQRISWWDIVSQMGVDRASVTFEDTAGGAIGDPVDLHVSGEKLVPWFKCERKIEDGIQEALDDLGWCT